MGTDSQYNTWKPNENQQVSGPIIFKPLTWDAKTRTLSFIFPASVKYESIDYTVITGLQDGAKKGVGLKAGEPQTISGLSEKFALYVTLDASAEGYVMDSYYIMSKSFAKDNYGYKGTVDDGLVVYDAHKNMVTLEAVYKAFKINK